MRAVVTGQVGMDKKAFLERVAEVTAQAGRPVRLCNVGESMYAEAPDVTPGRILDLPLSRLHALRRSVFKDILAECDQAPDVIVNTHATFRWRHGLFYAFDHDLMKTLNADLYVTLVDNIDRVHGRLLRDGHAEHTLKDLMVWREEEILATELLAHIFRGHGCFYILARGTDDSAAEAMARLMVKPYLKKAYLSFPMTNVSDAEVLAEIDSFRAEMKRYFICFDPGELDEKHLGPPPLAAAEEGRRFVTLSAEGGEIQVETAELLSILGDIDGQIYARDFKLIDQSDMIVSLVPQYSAGEGGAGRAIISSGVERELQHAHEAAKEVFVIWTPRETPSPFITETATRVFRSVGEAVDYFHANDYVPAAPAGGLFG